uniref:F-box domain-containing protein n=1 Tax=Panagrolaimus superbus TaxID=310955 RepID=A0A914YTX1_9BILA
MAWEGADELKAEEIVLRSTLAQRPSRLPPPLPSSPPPPVVTLLKPKNSIPQKSSSSSASISTSEDSSSDEGRPSTSSEENESTSEDSDICESLKLLKFQRSSPDRESNAPEKLCQINQMPYHVLRRIFSRLEIHERARAATVCRKWYNLLTDGKSPLENVVVLNIFQKSIWEASVNKNAGSTVQCLRVPDLEALVGVLLHVSEPSSIKIWYNTPKFAKMILEKIAEIGVKTKCVDIFPYSKEVGIEVFYEQLPNLTAITMRPHGTDYFWQGLDLYSFPKFESLDTLVLDSFNLRGDLELPENISTFEFQNRRDGSFIEILPKLSKLKKLEYLHVGHADFQNTWPDLIDAIHSDKCPNLMYLYLRFCRFGKDSNFDSNFVFLPGKIDTLKKLKYLKLDLCYGYMPKIVRNFLSMTTSNLSMASINMISDESFELFEQIYGDISNSLKARNVNLQLGLLQKAERKNNPESQQIETPTTYSPPSYNFLMVLVKLESSFCDNFALLQSLFIDSIYPFLFELKFIQCPAVSNEILKAISIGCPRLKRLSILSCINAEAPGMLEFVKNFNSRKSEVLEIIWKRDINRHSRPAAFYLELTRSENRQMLAENGLNHKFIVKTPSDQNSGEAVIIKCNENPKKKLIIQDFDQHDTQRILGAVVPAEDDEIVAAVVAAATAIAAATVTETSDNNSVPLNPIAPSVVSKVSDEPPPSYTPPPIPFSESPINRQYVEVTVTTSQPTTPTSTISSVDDDDWVPLNAPNKLSDDEEKVY